MKEDFHHVKFCLSLLSLIENQFIPLTGKAAAYLQLNLKSISEQLNGELNNQETLSNEEGVVRKGRYVT